MMTTGKKQQFVIMFIPTDNPQVIVALGSLWLPDYIFDYENDILKVAGANENYKLKRTYERQKFQDIAVLVKVSAARMKARIIMEVWVITSSFRRAGGLQPHRRKG